MLKQLLTDTESANLPQKQPNRLTAMLMKWFFRSASVTEVQRLSDHFCLITLAGDELRNVSWIPGQKIQIEFGEGIRRTYTPISWDPITGVTRILVFLHGKGPSSDWALSQKPGDPCLFFGPRGSLDLNNLAQSTLIYGDETSFGLAHAVKITSGLKNVILLFEVSSLPESQQVLQVLGLTGATLVQREMNDTHLREVEDFMIQNIEEHSFTHYILTGKASSILHLRKALKLQGITSSQLKVKAYWALGKKGLD